MELKILVAFDIKNEQPHKAVRLYDTNGKSLGFGEIKVSEIPEEKNLFDEKLGVINYLCDLDIEKLTGQKIAIPSANPKTKEQKEADLEIEDTGDPEEDEWVRKSVSQLKSAKAKYDLTTIMELRDDFRKMKAAREKRKAEEAAGIKVETQAITIETLDLATDDELEDKYVRACLSKIKFKSADEGMELIKKFRDEYRNAKLHHAKSNDDSLKDDTHKAVASEDQLVDFSIFNEPEKKDEILPELTPPEKKEEPKKTNSLDDIFNFLS